MALPRPEVSSQRALNLASKLYSFEPRNISVVAELESYEDRNFLLKVQIAQAKKQTKCETKFVLKVLNPLMSSNTEALALTSKVFLFLNDKGVRCPLPQPSICGKYITWCRFPKIRQEASKWTGDEGFQVVDSTELPWPDLAKQVDNDPSYHGSDNDFEVYAVQLFSFLPGKPLCEVKFNADLMYKFGLEIGNLHKVLKEFSQTSDFHNSHLKASDNAWHLYNSPTSIMKYCHTIEDDSRRALVQEIALRFKQELVPKLEQLETQVIHGDLNEHNILVEHSPDGQVEFKGFLDFGELDVSCRALDIAIAVAYIMIEAVKQGINAIDAVSHMLKGYQSVFTLSSLEMEIVLEGAKTRICLSLVMGAYSFKYLAPDNDYLLYTAAGDWKALDELLQIPTKDMYESWFSC